MFCLLQEGSFYFFAFLSQLFRGKYKSLGRVLHHVNTQKNKESTTRVNSLFFGADDGI